MTKKICLEHTIRNVINESIGGPNTDKFKGTQKAFLQPAPHIEPKVGDSHPDGSSVTAKRGLAKIKQSETMKEEEQLEEGGKLKAAEKALEIISKTPKYADEIADDAAKMAKDFWSKIKPAEELPTVPTKPAEKLPATKVEKPAAAPKPAETKPNDKLPEVKPEVKTEVKPQVKPEVKPEVKTQTKPETTTVQNKLPEVKPQVKPETKTDTVTTTPTATKDTKPVKIELPNSQVKPSTKTQEILRRINRLKDENNDDNKPGKPEDRKRRQFGVPSIPINKQPVNPLRGYVPTNPYLHYADDRRSFGEEIDLDDAEKIKKKTRKAQIIRKIIDEQKKKKETSTVILNPKLKDQEMDSN